MFKQIFFVTTLVFLLSTILIAGEKCPPTGCGSCADKAKEIKSTASKDKVSSGNTYLTADGKERFVCPVMGNHGNVADATSFSDVNGKRYYHCCPGCEEPFQKEPAKYLEKLSLPANITKVEGKTMWAKCPVTSEEFKVGKDTPFADFNGNKYYLCCNDCKPAFVKNPSKYTTPDSKKS